VLHNNYGETKTGVLIIATYAGGRLEKATSQPMSVAPLSSADISETVELTSKTDEVKLFFWDSLTNVQSYGKTISIDVAKKLAGITISDVLNRKYVLK
jgi:hypothetical protein